MATTLKKSISPDSLQCKEQCVAIKFQFLQNFSKSTAFIHIIADHFSDNPALLTLGVTVLSTINTHEFHLSVKPGSKFKIPSQYFAITF